MKRLPWCRSLIVCVLLTAVAACSFNLDDYTISGGHVEGYPAAYFTFRRTPSAQLLLLKYIQCRNDMDCVLREMRAKADGSCSWKLPGLDIGQAECNYALGSKFSGQIAAAIDAVKSVNDPAGCVQVKFWKSSGVESVCGFWGCWPRPVIRNNAQWYLTNNSCLSGGDLLD